PRLGGDGVIILLAIRGHTGVNRCWLVHVSLPSLGSLVSEVLRRWADVYLARATGTHERACLATNDRIDIPTPDSVAALVSAHPRPRPRGSSASNARLTTSLMDNPLAAANARTRRSRLCGRLTVQASLAAVGGLVCLSGCGWS